MMQLPVNHPKTAQRSGKKSRRRAGPPKRPKMDPMDTRVEQMTVARNLSSTSAPGTVGGPVRPGPRPPFDAPTTCSELGSLDILSRYTDR